MTAEDSRMSQYNKQTVDKLRKPGGKKRNAFVGNSHFILSMHQLRKEIQYELFEKDSWRTFSTDSSYVRD